MAAPAIVFAAGRGGSPDRHAATIERWRTQGIEVVAPTFPMLAGMRATAEELRGRVAIIAEAVNECGPDVRLTGVGHSIGATLLLAMAGSQLWLGPGQRLDIAVEPRLARLALLAPPVAFFRAPQALAGVSIPVLLRSGAADTVTPPADHLWLAAELSARAPVDFETIPEADHFSFMDVRPPGEAEAMPDAAAFRARMADDIAAFASA